MHEKEIYFSKIIFVQHRYSGNTYIQINLQEHEFSVQSFTYSLDPRAKCETLCYIADMTKRSGYPHS